MEEVEEAPNGVFFEDATEEEYEDYKLKEEQGWGGFIKKIFNAK
jgi:hypothetical protein